MCLFCFGCVNLDKLPEIELTPLGNFVKPVNLLRVTDSRVQQNIKEKQNLFKNTDFKNISPMFFRKKEHKTTQCQPSTSKNDSPRP